MPSSSPLPASTLLASARLRQFFLYFWLFTAAGLLWLYLKSLELGLPSGLLVLARLTGRVWGADAFSLLERLSLFREDGLLHGLCLPVLAGAAAAGVAHRRAGRFMLLLVLMAYVMFMFVSMLSLANVGTYLSAEMLYESLLWAQDQPQMVADYVSPRALLKLGVMLALLLGAHALLQRRGGAWFSARSLHVLAVLTATLALGMLTLAVALRQEPLQAYPQAHSAFRSALRALRPQSEPVHLSSRSLSELQQDYWHESQSELPSAVPGAPSPSARRDVLLFILETAPQALVDLPRLLSRWPSTEALLAQSHVAMQHFSTYPYTSDAMFSIFASVYPDARKRLIDSGRARHLGWVGLLAHQGYVTRQYAPWVDTFESDDRMYTALGFGGRYLAQKDPADLGPLTTSLREDFAAEMGAPPRPEHEAKLVRDHQAWQQLSRDVLAWKTKGQHFVAAFAPQIGHGPWVDLQPGDGHGDLAARAQALGRVQLSWLAHLVAELQARDQLRDTLIVITADHGLRTVAEYPSIPQGVLSTISTQVPLLIFNGGEPMALNARQPSSHVDLGPTVLALLGQRDTRPYVEGTDMRHVQHRQHITYMQGLGYLGAEAAYQDGRFYSQAPARRVCLRAGQGMFEAAEVLSMNHCEGLFGRFHAVHDAAMHKLPS